MAENDAKQKKILIGIIAVLVVIGAIYLVGNNSKSTSETSSQPAKTSTAKAAKAPGTAEFIKGRALAKENKLKEAFDMFIQAAEKGNIAAMNYAGMYLCNGYGGLQKDISKGIAYLTKAADAGLAAAQVNLGRAYMNPQYGLKRDFDKGLKYIMAAAEKNNGDAMLYMGYNYEVGRGVKKDKAKALEWYDKAVKAGNKAAAKRAEKLRKQQ